MKSKILLLYAKDYYIKTDDGKTLTGISVLYYPYDNLKAKISDDGAHGARIAKCSLPIMYSDKIQLVPGMYEGEFEMSVDSAGKSMLKLTDVTYLSEVELKQVTR